MRHLIDIVDLSVEEIDALLEEAGRIIEDPARYAHACDGRILGTLFFEPSTRTRLSFEAAMQRLGGSTLGFASADSSSATKGETVADTIRTVGCYADIIAMRHPREGAPLAAALRSFVPVINAGDGGHNHPTQTLTDLLTIQREKGRLSNLTVGLCGDLKFGRTVHSLVMALRRYAGINFVFISPNELRMPEYIMEGPLRDYPGRITQVADMQEAIGSLDILYMTRVQRERFFNEADYVRLKDTYILTPDKLREAKPDLAIMHPLPRVNEISHLVDDDPRAVYFEQMRYGMFVRMALILKLLEVQA